MNPLISDQCKHEHEKCFDFVWLCLCGLHSDGTFIVRIFGLYRASFGTEIYLKSIGHLQFKIAPFQIPANSHDFKIERGPYIPSVTNVVEYILLLHDGVIRWKHFLRYCPLWGESTAHRWIPITKASDAELCFLWSTPEQTVEQTLEMLVIWDAIAPIMTSL